MKLKEFIKNLKELVDENPEALEMEVVYSSDPEGNSFDRVYFVPTMGVYEVDDKDFRESDEEDHPFESKFCNAVCVN